MKKFIFLSIIFLAIKTSSAQNCRGVLFDSITSQPVEFANIGIVGKGIGTVTNEKGEYNFFLPDSLINCDIKISMIGYKSKNFKAKNFASLSKVMMTQDPAMLQEVPVAVKKSVVKVLGNNTTSSAVSAGFKKNNLGAEIAIKLNIKHPKTHLKKFFVKINSSTLEKALFRFNVYSADEKGNPKENILKQNIIIEPLQKTGLISFDLTPYNIFVDEDVFIALEWIKDLGDAKGLYFSTKLVGSSTYFRQASQDKWEKTSPVGVGFHAEVAY